MSDRLKIAACYIRVSTDDQLEYSPDSQLAAIQRYAKQNGYILPEEYIFIEQEGYIPKVDNVNYKRKAGQLPAFSLMSRSNRSIIRAFKDLP